MRMVGKFGDIKTIMDVMTNGITAEMIIFEKERIRAIETSRTVYKELKPSALSVEGDGVIAIGPVEFNDVVTTVFSQNEFVDIEVDENMIIFKSPTAEITIPNKDISRLVFPPDNFLSYKDGKGYMNGNELPTRLIFNTKDIEKVSATIKKLKLGSAKVFVSGMRAEAMIGEDVRGATKAKLIFNVEATDDIRFDIPLAGYMSMKIPTQNLIVFLGINTPLLVYSIMNVGELLLLIAPRVDA